MPAISIIIPVKHGGHVAAFESIRRSSLDKNSYEVLLAEGAAPSQQRNMAAREASGDLLYFIDDDSMLNSDNLKICSEIMTDSDVAVVGGPSLSPDSDSRIQRLFGAALGSILGAGAVRNRYRAAGTVRETTEKELILCNLSIRRSVFLEMGGFNEALYPNEENELLDRIKISGFKLVHAPKMYVVRSQRKSMNAFIRQMFVYGRGRGQQSLITGKYPLISFIPLFFVLYLISSLFFWGTALFYVPLLCYLVLTLIFTFVEVCRYRSPDMLLLFLLFPLMHTVNGLGLISGLVNGKPSPVSDSSIKVTIVKGFGHDFV